MFEEVQDSLEILRQMAQGTALEALGIEITEATPERVVAHMGVDGRHTQIMGYLHGGISVLLAETAASILAALGTDAARQVVFGQEISASHLRSVLPGARLRAVAEPVHRGRSSVVSSIHIYDETDKLICLSRCTVAVREKR